MYSSSQLRYYYFNIIKETDATPLSKSDFKKLDSYLYEALTNLTFEHLSDIVEKPYSEIALQNKFYTIDLVYSLISLQDSDNIQHYAQKTSRTIHQFVCLRDALKHILTQLEIQY